MSSFNKPSLAVDFIGKVYKDNEKVTIQIPLDFLRTFIIESEKVDGSCEGKMPIGCQDDISDCVEFVNSIGQTAENIKKFEILDKEDVGKETEEATTSLRECKKDNEKDLNNSSFESHASSDIDRSYESSEQTEVDYELSQQQW
jgi:hypothetical protein